MIEVIEKLRIAAEHADEPLSLTWESWALTLNGKCQASRVTGDLKTYLTRCLFAEPLNLTFSLYSEGQLREFVETSEFFSRAAQGGYFIVGDRDLDFACVSLNDESVTLIPGWSITEGVFSKEKRHKSLKTFLRGEIKLAKVAMANRRESDRLHAEFERASGKDPNVVDEHGFTKYHGALLAGDLEAVRRELNRGARFDTITGNGRSPLEMAISSGNADLVRLLVELGCDPNASNGNKRGLTFMHLAAMHASVEIVRVLHESGADLDRGVGEYAETPMGIAISRIAGRDAHEIVAYLLEQGVNPSKYLLTAVSLRRCVTILLEHGADPNVNDAAPLKMALESGNSDIAEQLLAAGADLGLVTGMLGSMIFKPDIKQVLRAAGADID